MILFPAIDIKSKKVVRLFQGKFDAVTEYSDDPVAIARQWKSQGAEWLHIVDLDGAEQGILKNFDFIRDIKKETGLKVQVGGGIRNIGRAILLLDEAHTVNADRIILGTTAIEDQEFFSEVLERWKDRVAVSIDCSNGFVTQRGWTKISDVKGVDLARALEKKGVKTLIYTDIARDGALTGPNLVGLKEILDSVHVSVIASGGISNIKDVQDLQELGLKYQGRLIGAITGRAIYEGKLDFKKAIELCNK